MNDILLEIGLPEPPEGFDRNEFEKKVTELITSAFAIPVFVFSHPIYSRWEQTKGEIKLIMRLTNEETEELFDALKVAVEHSFWTSEDAIEWLKTKCLAGETLARIKEDLAKWI